MRARNRGPIVLVAVAASLALLAAACGGSSKDNNTSPSEDNSSNTTLAPLAAATITLSYNLGGVDKLKLDGPTIAKIFQRQIKTWDDPAIKELNSGAKLPSKAISVVHRSDSSGTTENFTKYLKAAAPGVWTLD